MTFTHNVEELHVIKIITNNMVNACSIAIAFRWSAVVEIVFRGLVNPYAADEQRTTVWSETIVALSATLLLTAFAAIALRVGGTMHRARQRIVAHIEDLRAEVIASPAKKRPVIEQKHNHVGTRIYVMPDWPGTKSLPRS
jgi:hypothetical protein